MIELKYPHNITHLIFRGFLGVQAHIGPLRVLLKTINENEFDEIALYSGMSFEEISEIEDHRERSLVLSRFYPWLVAWGIASINGVNALAFRREPAWYTDIVKAIQQSEISIVQEVAGGIQRLQLWYNFEVLNVERLAIEPFSRASWPSYRGVPLNSPTVTGFPGTDLLGLNRHQILFKAYLQQWFDNQFNENFWELSKFLGGFFDSKAVRRIHGQDKVRRNMERAYEERILEGSATRLDKESIWEELEEELNKQLKGEKDEFDELVDSDALRYKLELLTSRMMAEVYSMKYGRKLVRQDMGIIGYDPKNDLPMGQFNTEEASHRLKEKLKDINSAGTMDIPLEVSIDLENKIIQLADQVADETFHQLQRKNSQSQSQEQKEDDNFTNIEIRSFEEPEEQEVSRDPAADSFFDLDDGVQPGTDFPS